MAKATRKTAKRAKAKAKPKATPRRRPRGTTGELAVEYVDPKTLVPDPDNPRKMNAEQRRTLSEGLEAFGWVLPIIAQRKTRMVVGGHQRLEDALGKGQEQVPVVFVTLSDADAKALNVLLNNPQAQGGYDYDRLAAWLGQIERDGLDATLTGFRRSEIDQLLQGNDPGPQMKLEHGEEEDWRDETIHQIMLVYTVGAFERVVDGLEVLRQRQHAESFTETVVTLLAKHKAVKQAVGAPPVEGA